MCVCMYIIDDYDGMAQQIMNSHKLLLGHGNDKTPLSFFLELDFAAVHLLPPDASHIQLNVCEIDCGGMLAYANKQKKKRLPKNDPLEDQTPNMGGKKKWFYHST